MSRKITNSGKNMKQSVLLLSAFIAILSICAGISVYFTHQMHLPDKTFKIVKQAGVCQSGKENTSGKIQVVEAASETSTETTKSDVAQDEDWYIKNGYKRMSDEEYEELDPITKMILNANGPSNTPKVEEEKNFDKNNAFYIKNNFVRLPVEIPEDARTDRNPTYLVHPNSYGFALFGAESGSIQAKPACEMMQKLYAKKFIFFVNQVQPGDLILYFDASGRLQHAAAIAKNPITGDKLLVEKEGIYPIYFTHDLTLIYRNRIFACLEIRKPDPEAKFTVRSSKKTLTSKLGDMLQETIDDTFNETVQRLKKRKAGRNRHPGKLEG